MTNVTGKALEIFRLHSMGEPKNFWGVTILLILKFLCVWKVAEEWNKLIYI